ncbi:C-type lectin-related protein 4 [Elysia marginata]|uniref:C-type lectin-related protein 4 n=1 Tax=Elysia marginata TaxID=1093978 RepID=A0AAV4FDQ3_9GAST|nr:C-type lectin-related protein 4 [Elysia marginata]
MDDTCSGVWSIGMKRKSNGGTASPIPVPRTVYSFTKKHSSAILIEDLNGLSNITWSETTNPIQCARKTYGACDKPKGFLHDSESKLCQPMFWTDETETPNTRATNSTLYLFNRDRSCKDGFQAIKYGSLNTLACLAFQTEKLPYHFAGLRCTELGGYLASAKTAAKLALLVDLVQGQSFWVGLDDRKKNTVFVWAEDNSLLTLKQIQDVFRPGEPSHQALEHCAGVNLPTEKLDDRKCSFQYNFICEAKPGCR